MDLFEAIRSRRSVRSFLPHPIPAGVVFKLIDAASHAPSAGNLQPWEFVIVEEPETLRKLASASFGQEFMARAPVVIVACADTERSASVYGPRGQHFYAFADVCAATENLLLAATALGLGACWIGAFDEEKIKDILELPEEVVPIAVVPLGYPASIPTATEKVGIQHIIHFEKYGQHRIFEYKPQSAATAAPARESDWERSLLEVFE